MMLGAEPKVLPYELKPKDEIIVGVKQAPRRLSSPFQGEEPLRRPPTEG